MARRARRGTKVAASGFGASPITTRRHRPWVGLPRTCERGDERGVRGVSRELRTATTSMRPVVSNGHVDVHVGDPDVAGDTRDGALKRPCAREESAPLVAQAARWPPKESSLPCLPRQLHARGDRQGQAQAPQRQNAESRAHAGNHPRRASPGSKTQPRAGGAAEASKRDAHAGVSYSRPHGGRCAPDSRDWGQATQKRAAGRAETPEDPHHAAPQRQQAGPRGVRELQRWLLCRRPRRNWIPFRGLK